MEINSSSRSTFILCLQFVNADDGRFTKWIREINATGELARKLSTTKATTIRSTKNTGATLHRQTMKKQPHLQQPHLQQPRQQQHLQQIQLLTNKKSLQICLEFLQVLSARGINSNKKRRVALSAGWKQSRIRGRGSSISPSAEPFAQAP